MSEIIPNGNPHLVVLTVWASRADGLEDVQEFPIIAWRITEGDAPIIPISTDGEPARDEFCDWMIYDRAADRGYSGVTNTHGRERCIEELQADISLRRHNRGLK